MDRAMSESSKRGETTTGSDDEQKMIKELKGMEMYEVGMSTEEMTGLITAVRASRMPSQLLNANTSHRNSVSPELSSNQYANTTEKGDSSEENFLTPPKRNPFTKDTTNINKNRMSINENPSESNENKRILRINSQLRNEEKIPKWKINPLDFIANDKDVTLMSRFSLASNRDNESFKTLNNVEMTIGQLSLHLQKLSDARRAEKRIQYNSTWGTAIKASTMDEKFHEDEGSEIGASTSTNENIDELPSGRKRRVCVKLHTYNDTVDDNSDEDFEIHEKKKKSRKSESNSLENFNIDNSPQNNMNREDSYNFESILDESDDEIITKPKKKKVHEKKIEKCKKIVELVSTEEIKTNSIENDETPICLEDSDEITIYDVESQSFKKLKKSLSAETATSSSYRKILPPIPTTSSYPRRIIPPNPTKYSRIRARKPLHQPLQVNKPKRNDDNENAEVTTNELTRTISRGKSKLGLMEDEISALISEDEKIEEPSSSDQSNRSSRLSSRLKNQCEILKAESQKDKEAEYIRQQEQKIKEEAADKLKQERVRQRIRNEAEKVKAEELQEKRKLAMQEQWRSKVKAKEKEKQRQIERTELNPEGPRNSNDNLEVMVENPYATNETEARSDNRRSRKSPIEETPCPICGKTFPVVEIEAHAASCEEYEATNSIGGSRSNSPEFPTTSRITKRRNTELFECVTCSNYKAKDGRDFEQHVKSCLSRLKDGGEGSDVIVSVPDSPIRSLRRTSEQTDSEINYTNQFAPKTRSKTNSGVKRKR